MDDVEQALSVLNRLRSLGVQIAVDDFGTGNSSLVYLRRLPVDVLKIDKAFVRGIGSDRTDETIAGTVVSLAHALGVRAVAEGVERSEQARTLATLGCDLGQGYLWTRPLPAAEADRWLRSHSLAE